MAFSEIVEFDHIDDRVDIINTALDFSYRNESRICRVLPKSVVIEGDATLYLTFGDLREESI